MDMDNSYLVRASTVGDPYDATGTDQSCCPNYSSLPILSQVRAIPIPFFIVAVIDDD
jgi:hypothetical protein